MKSRVYVLLDVIEGAAEHVARTLESQSGVTNVDVLAGPPDVMMIVEAAGEKKLAQLTVKALDTVDSLTKNMQLLPARPENGLAGQT